MIQVMGSPKIVENRGKESNFRSQQLYTMPSKHSCFFFFLNLSPPPLTQEPFTILSREHAEGLVCATPEWPEVCPLAWDSASVELLTDHFTLKTVHLDELYSHTDYEVS